MCALLPALPSTGTRAIYMARGVPAATPSERLVEDTFYVTEGIEVISRLLPLEKGVDVRAATELVPGVGVDASGRLYGTPDRPGTYSAAIRLCAGRVCAEEQVTFVVLRNVPWSPRALTFPGRTGEPLEGRIQIAGGPSGVLPTFSVTDYDTLPAGVSIGPDGNVGGVPTAPGVSRIPVQICVAGNCAGVVVTLIIV
ncbi:hypothetical protein [Nonomuraea sp. LPB2021202275-12-8]|uniref:hypothetical protein n=1 Tax=Nonomuraea sp. LPB2021202275-12-8 TaxID=3120159 RepID=UPI00300D8168